MAIKKYNTSLRNLEARLRIFKEHIPTMLKEIVQDNEDAIVSYIRNDQLYRRGVNGQDVKIWSYAPYAVSTLKKKKKKGQPTTRVTLKDEGDFHAKMHLVFEPDGFYITSEDEVTPFLRKRYGDEIFRLTDKNLTKLLQSRIRKEFIRRIKQATKP